MRLAPRPAVRLLAPLALLAVAPARASVTGGLEVQSQTTQSASRPEGGPTQSSTMTLLMERLFLHYAGLPFGSAVAIATAGGSFSDLHAWHDRGLETSGRVLSFDASLGFLPRRAVPLRLYAGGSVVDGTGGALATSGVGPSLLFGGSLNLEPGSRLPGMRLDASESRSSRPGYANLSDAHRRLVATSYDTIRGQRLALGLRLEDDHREGAGDVTSRGATLDWSSTRHQSSVFASEVRRSLPSLSGITSDRLASGTSEQRWSPTFSTRLAGRLSEAEAGAASGRLGDARAAFTWVPSWSQHQLTLSGSASAGFTRTSSPGNEANGSSHGAGGRAGYGRSLGPLSANLAVGAATSTSSSGLGNVGTTTQLDATASLVLLAAPLGSAQAEYALVRALAPLGRGGDRLENHARGIGRLAVGQSGSVHASLAYDAGVRELVDITAGRAVSLRERALTASLGASTSLGRFSPSAEVRYVRNGVVAEGSPFVAAGSTQARSLASAQASASWSPRDDLGLQAQLLASRATLVGSRWIDTRAANVTLSWRLGRLTVSAQAQAARVQLGDSPSSFQQSIRAVLSRPFEL